MRSTTALRIGALFAGACAASSPASQPRPAVEPSPVPTIVQLTDVPQGALELHVTVDRWICTITYPNGEVSTELHVPVGRPVRLVLRSLDVDHEVEVGDPTIQQVVKPGAYAQLAFGVSREGTFAWKCPIAVPPGHAPESASRPFVAEAAGAYRGFETGLHEATHPTTPAGWIALGKSLYETKGCIACHSVDGTSRVGPSWLGIWGTTVTLADGSQRKADAAYVEESILKPTAFARPGYPPSMPSYEGQLRPDEIKALVAYIESLARP
jgi:cytochrome c oxidase subunit 2